MHNFNASLLQVIGGGALSVQPPMTAGMWGLFHLDGGFLNEVSGSSGDITPSGSQSFARAAKFNQALSWDSPGFVLTADICDEAVDVMAEGWVLWDGGGDDAWVFEFLDSAGVPHAGFGIRPSNGTGLLIRTGHSQVFATLGKPSGGAYHHYCAIVSKSGADKKFGVAIDGNWVIYNELIVTNFADGNIKIRGLSDPLGGIGRHLYDEVRVITGAENVAYTPGVNFTPPSSPFTGFESY